MFSTGNVRVSGGEYFVVPARAVDRDPLQRHSTYVRLQLSWQAFDGQDTTGALLFAVSNPLEAVGFHHMTGPPPAQACDVRSCLESLSALVRSGQRTLSDDITPAEHCVPHTFANHQELARSPDFQIHFRDDTTALDSLERDYAVGFGFALVLVPVGCASIVSAWSSLSSAPALLVAGGRAYDATRFDLVAGALNCTTLWWSNGTRATTFACDGEMLVDQIVVPAHADAARARALRAVRVQATQGSQPPSMNLAGDEPSRLIDEPTPAGARDKCCIS